MSALKSVAGILKRRFNSLTVEETIDLAQEIVEKTHGQQHNEAGLRISQALEAALDASKCGHGRLHVFCGQCSPLSSGGRIPVP